MPEICNRGGVVARPPRPPAIAGVEATSLIDFPGHLSAVLFVQGCDFRCPFCHNPELIATGAVVGPGGCFGMPLDELADLLARRVRVLDGIVITGGEPLLHPGLADFAAWIRSYGYAVKLDTNGSLPDRLEAVLAGVIDYVAMDVKSSPERYAEAAGCHVDVDRVARSIALIRASGLPHEFRSTVLPRLHDEPTVRAMARMIAGAPRYYLQRFRPARTLDPAFRSERPFTDDEMQALAAAAREFVEGCTVR